MPADPRQRCKVREWLAGTARPAFVKAHADQMAHFAGIRSGPGRIRTYDQGIMSPLH